MVCAGGRVCVWYMLVGVCLVYVAEGCVSGVCWWGVLVGVYVCLVCVVGVCVWHLLVGGVCVCCVLVGSVGGVVSGMCWWGRPGLCVMLRGCRLWSVCEAEGVQTLVSVWGWGVQTPAPCVCGSGWARLGAEVRSDLGPGGAPAVPRVL